MKKVFFIILLLFSCFNQNVVAQSSSFKITRVFHIGGTGGWDYLTVGPSNNRLYVSHGSQVNVLDKTTGDSIGIIENTTGVHGIAFDASQGKGFTSNGRLNNVTVFDLRTNTIITTIPAGQNPDAILYEPFSKTIITCNGRGKNLSILDPVNHKLMDSIFVGGKPETAVPDGKGKLFVNIEDLHEIVVIDIFSRKVIAHWPLQPGEEPTGLSYDKKNNRLFAGCGNKLLAVINSLNGTIITTLPIGDGCDGTAFDPVTNTIFTSNGEGMLSVFRERPADVFVDGGTVITKRGARTICLDPETHLIYLPTAEFEKADPATPDASPKMIQGSFQVLVISN
jgi:DNA-binding beta-propeller fold protein YncE